MKTIILALALTLGAPVLAQTSTPGMSPPPTKPIPWTAADMCMQGNIPVRC